MRFLVQGTAATKPLAVEMTVKKKRNFDGVGERSEGSTTEKSHSASLLSDCETKDVDTFS